MTKGTSRYSDRRGDQGLPEGSPFEEKAETELGGCSIDQGPPDNQSK
jgi:hypothetical protein